MFCKIMFASLDSLVSYLSAWCSDRYSFLAKFWIIAFVTILLYSLLILCVKVVIYMQNYYHDAVFIKFYRAVEQNELIKSVCLLDGHPDFVNKFKYPEGYTPFMVACANSNTQLVRYMLQKGADVKLKSKSNETPFYLASFFYIQNRSCKNATCIRELYYSGADINEPSRNNMTVLQMAAVFGHTSLVKWLLLKNANVKTYPHPYLLAKSQGHHDVANLIASSIKLKSIE